MLKFFVILQILLFLIVTPAFAQDAYSDEEYVKQQKEILYKAEIERISSYLNNIKTFVSPFIQTTMSGSVSTGMFYLSRPGKLRWEYDPPVPLLIVAKGSLLAYYDSELDQVSHIGLEDTLAGFLTKKVISFSDPEIEVLRFDRDNDYTAITIAGAGKIDEGQLKLIFKNKEIELVKMFTLDAVGQETKIDFTSVKNNIPLEENLFKMPKTKKRRR